MDLSVHGGPLFPQRADDEERSSGLQLAVEPVVRFSPYWGLGVVAQHARLGFVTRATGADAGDVYLTQAALIGRFTPLGDSLWHPYVQLGVGVGDYVAVPECLFCSVEDTVLLSAALGLEYTVLPHLRVGLSLTAFMFGAGVAEPALPCRQVHHQRRTPLLALSSASLRARALLRRGSRTLAPT